MHYRRCKVCGISIPCRGNANACEGGWFMCMRNEDAVAGQWIRGGVPCRTNLQFSGHLGAAGRETCAATDGQPLQQRLRKGVGARGALLSPGTLTGSPLSAQGLAMSSRHGCTCIAEAMPPFHQNLHIRETVIILLICSRISVAEPYRPFVSGLGRNMIT